MIFLSQTDYEDDNGRRIESAKIQFLAAYRVICDGFYNWACGGCGAEHSDRWWKISGRVMQCDDCKGFNLLVRTDCDFINEVLDKRATYDFHVTEVARLQGVEKYNAEERTKIKQTIVSSLVEWIDKLKT